MKRFQETVWRLGWYGLVTQLFGLSLVGTVAGLSLAASAQVSWSKPIKLSAGPGPSQYPWLTHDPTTGDLFVIWTHSAAAEQSEVFGRRWHRASSTWMATENLSLSEWQDSSPLLFFDSHGQGFLIWTRRYAASQGAPADGTDLVWRSWEGTGWAAEQVLLHNDFFLPGTYGLIPVELPDAIWLFITWGNGYSRTEYRDGGWSELSQWEYLIFQNPEVHPILSQIIVDDHGMLHAAAFGENSSQQGLDKYFYDAYYLAHDGSQWRNPLNLSSTDGVASGLGLAFDGQGRLHFLWLDPKYPYSTESTKSAIWERVYDGDRWGNNTEVTVHNDDQAVSDFSLTSDRSNILHLAWSEGSMVGGGHSRRDIYYQASNGTTWGPEEVVLRSAAESLHPSLVPTHDGASLAWQEGLAPNCEVYFARGVTRPQYWTYLPLISK